MFDRNYALNRKRVVCFFLRPIARLVGIPLPFVSQQTPQKAPKDDVLQAFFSTLGRYTKIAFGSEYSGPPFKLFSPVHRAILTLLVVEHGDGVLNSERIESFDWLRMLSALMVFTFHTSQPFSRNASWPIHNREKSAWVDALILSMDAWLMPLLMVLSGASARYALDTRSGGEFIRERTLRILFPCVVGLLTLCPLQSYLRRRLQGTYTGSFVRFYPQFFKGIYPEGNLGYYHLWFSVYLFVYAMVSLPVFLYLRGDMGRRWLARLAMVSTSTPSTLAFFGVPLMVGQVALRGTFPKTYFVVNDWAFHALLLPLFIYGYILVSDKRFMQAIEKQWLFALFPSFILTGILYAHEWGIYRVSYATKWAIFGLSSWLWVLMTIGMAQAWLKRGGKVLAYAREATYPFYLLHQPVIATIAYYVVQSKMPMLYKWVSIHALSLGATLGLYELGRRWNITRCMLGLKRCWVV